ncbi:MAG: acyl CoA transferase/carnitine dehydratase [Bacteroidetes bacterium]|jgi:crotonobetainyl-CoA:carnitine CoA-transferase CaiB-like acyl-CoA transferase|nr:acyl CoA transferase/carnitine dehydratase [Bacteroidota bacterium]
MNTFFKDLKIIELANVLAGPAVGMFFSELGAEVIKVENKLTSGDVTRSWKLADEDPASSSSAYYASVNYNKKSIILDLTLESEKKKIYELVKTADIVITNYKPGDDIKLGMDYDTLKKIKTDIIYASITGFGDQMKRTAYDLILQAETGFMFMNGTKESGPVKMPVALIDILAAHQLKEGILVAFIKRLKTGNGSKVSVSLYDSAIASLANQASNWLMTGHDPQRNGSLHPNIAPYGEIFITADHKQIVLAIGNNKQFKLLCEIIGGCEIASDPKFTTNTERVKHREELYNHIQPFFSKLNSHKIINELIASDIPAGIIRSVKEVFNDEQAKSLINSENPDGIKTHVVKTAVFKIR